MMMFQKQCLFTSSPVQATQLSRQANGLLGARSGCAGDKKKWKTDFFASIDVVAGQR